MYVFNIRNDIMNDDTKDLIIGILSMVIHILILIFVLQIMGII
jgi:hypothetical protein